MVDLDIDIGDEVGLGHGDDRFRLLTFRLKKVMARIDHLAAASATMMVYSCDGDLASVVVIGVSVVKASLASPLFLTACPLSLMFYE
ncbi:hypothetical protein M8C21_033130 [Ambrosia artemisiifolia]|uniref:Uncharacterized protein n=1 Tax=Ambrosia artemisiifolia TaxID=4212 RepID=A0AAD5D434_AMBAR|nr:hypothetical protein M8C21_033130 [Ambrosia artemisiifolia]